MATHKGCEGVVKVDDNTIAEVKDWSLTETTEILDASSMSSCAKVKKAGMTDATGSITCHWDETDTNGQGALTNGAEVTLNLYPAGAITGDTFVTFDAIIITRGTSASFDGIVEASFDFEVTGVVTWGVVA